LKRREVTIRVIRFCGLHFVGGQFEAVTSLGRGEATSPTGIRKGEAVDVAPGFERVLAGAEGWGGGRAITQPHVATATTLIKLCRTPTKAPKWGVEWPGEKSRP